MTAVIMDSATEQELFLVHHNTGHFALWP